MRPGSLSFCLGVLQACERSKPRSPNDSHRSRAEPGHRASVRRHHRLRVPEKSETVDVADLFTARGCCNPRSRAWQALSREVLANGRLLDLIRRVRTFGVSLACLDIRQESDRPRPEGCEIRLVE